MLFLQLLMLFNVHWLIESKIVGYQFDIRYIDGWPDGVNKKVLSVNDQFPGPTIEAEIGDILHVDVANWIQDGQNVTIHWHGLTQKGSHFEDGTNMITQCPLKYKHHQRYVIPLNQSGTYWYHSHVDSQYTEGLWGAIIIRNKPEVFEYDEEILVLWNEWYHPSGHENEAWHLSPGSRGVPPFPWSGMMNGWGRYPCEYATLQNRTCTRNFQYRPVFQVSQGKTIRVRVISGSGYAAFNFSIEGHRLETIEVDGVDVAEPVVADIATIYAGQRYSFLIRTNGTETRYLIRATLRKELLLLLCNWPNLNPYPEALMSDVTGVLEYVPSKPKKEPYKEIHSYDQVVPPGLTFGMTFLNEFDLKPYDGSTAPDYYDREYSLVVDFFEDHEDIRRGSFNRTPFFLPDHKPLLMMFLDGEELPGNAMTLEVGHMEVVQIVINNPFYGPHPFHLHGHHFWVMGSGPINDGDYDPSRHTLSLTGPKRDTIFVHELSWGVFRFVADNPGIWTFHCHIDWHLLSGMSLVFLEAKEIAINMKVSEEAKRICGLFEE